MASKARKALKKAFGTESTADFQKLLFTYQEPQAPNTFDQIFDISKDKFMKLSVIQTRKKNKERARSVVKNKWRRTGRNTFVALTIFCANPQCSKYEASVGKRFKV